MKIDIDEIRRKVDKIEPRPIGIKNEYSVLIPLVERDGGWEILYELRAKDMDRQPGEISFPGGGVEADESYEEAAIRETMEELNIGRNSIEIIGELNPLVSCSGLRIHCFLGILSDINLDQLMPNQCEVDHVFTVPLDFLMREEPQVYQVGFTRKMGQEFPYNLIPNGRDYDWNEMKDLIYFYIYGDYTIWGFTARMTKNFIDIIK